MIKNRHKKLTLDKSETYQIKVPGKLEQSWADWAGRLTVTLEYDEDGFPVTTLTGTLDQAALQGILRGLYSIGLPLISVTCISK